MGMHSIGGGIVGTGAQHHVRFTNRSLSFAWSDAMIASHWGRTAKEFNFAIGFLPRSFLTVVRGKGENYLPLYEFVEAWDGATDFDILAKSLPTLTPGQIGGAIQFIRKLSQFNAAGIDIDDIEDNEIESSSAFQEAVRRSFKEQGGQDVFNFADTNG